MKDHTIRRVVNDLRDTAVKFHATQQLRERLRSCIEPLITAAAPDALPDVPYSGLEQRFFQGLNTITRRAVLQVLGGHTDALMEQVRNRGDERRLFKHLFKAAPAAPSPGAGKAPFTKGDTFPSGDCGHYESGIHNVAGNHYQAIVCYGTTTAEKADATRDQVLDALLAPSTGYTKHGYILQAADGHQTWLKGDPATGMGRYGKIIQLYKKEPPCLP